jgi:hypothetical protein
MYLGIVAHIVFWILLAAGWDELPRLLWIAFLGSWIAGYIVARATIYGGLFSPYVALVDVIMVLLIFKGDVRLR